MSLARIEKDDIMDSVWMELERMFTVLANQDSTDKSLFLREVETAMRKSLIKFTASLAKTN